LGISLEHITKRFGAARALDDVSLELLPGERVGLIGENGAGKSSLMNVLYGLYQPDEGSVRFDGQPVVLKSPREALKRGVGMVQQHFTLVPTLSVAENVVLGAEPLSRGLLDLERAVREVEATCKQFGFALDARRRVDSLSVGSQQKVEIVKALHRGATTLILDEPTAVLTPQEADELFAVTRALSDAGKTVVLISHKLKEVLAFATRIAVMRRGKKVADGLTPAQTSALLLAELMVGGEASALTRAEAVKPRPTGAAVLTLDQVHAPGLEGVSLDVHAGEIVGIAGVDGNGQRELAEVVTGLLPFQRGTVTIVGTRHVSLTPGDARKLGVSHIPEDRHLRAMVGDFTVEENVALGRQQLAPFARGPFIDFAGRRARTTGLLEKHDVRPREPAQRMAELSGGNQQKLVVARELDAAPKLLVVVQPTRGLDIAAVEAVRGHLRRVRDEGCAVLLVSLDLDEVLALADRVVVMFDGRLNGEFARGVIDELELGRRMLGAEEPPLPWVAAQ
jgi:general nucleoside transport system ATP-binding protein